jgi:proteasome assembly chaperone (PAC2) family protein
MTGKVKLHNEELKKEARRIGDIIGKLKKQEETIIVKMEESEWRAKEELNN